MPKAVKLRTGLLTKLLIVILLAALVCEVYALREQVSDAEEGKARQRHKGAKFHNAGNFAFQNAPNLRLHTVSSFSFP